MILTQAQAQAVYRAMSELNDVGGMIGVTFGEARMAQFPKSRRIEVWRSGATEVYSGQVDFAAAYGID